MAKGTETETETETVTSQVSDLAVLCLRLDKWSCNRNRDRDQSGCQYRFRCPSNYLQGLLEETRMIPRGFCPANNGVRRQNTEFPTTLCSNGLLRVSSPVRHSCCATFPVLLCCPSRLSVVLSLSHSLTSSQASICLCWTTPSRSPPSLHSTLPHTSLPTTPICSSPHKVTSLALCRLS